MLYGSNAPESFDGYTRVHPEGQIGEYHINTKPEQASWIWVVNVLRSDWVTYDIGADEVVVTTHSTHDHQRDGKRTKFLNPSHDFDALQKQYGDLLKLVDP